jgi:hypothetical protein
MSRRHEWAAQHCGPTLSSILLAILFVSLPQCLPKLRTVNDFACRCCSKPNMHAINDAILRFEYKYNSN